MSNKFEKQWELSRDWVKNAVVLWFQWRKRRHSLKILLSRIAGKHITMQIWMWVLFIVITGILIPLFWIPGRGKMVVFCSLRPRACHAGRIQYISFLLTKKRKFNIAICTEKKVYNYRHSPASRTSENLFAIISKRWRVFRTVLQMDQSWRNWISVMAEMVLHNHHRKSSSRNLLYAEGLLDAESQTGERATIECYKIAEPLLALSLVESCV